MSYVDLEDPANNTTIASSGRSCRLRNQSPLTTPLSMSRCLSRRVFSSTSTSENNQTNSTTSTPLQPITPISHTSSPSYPNPVLLDLDLEDDLDTSLPPRPITSIPNPHHQVLLEPVVALIDCTAGNRIALTSTQINPSNPIHQLSPEPMVALNGCTNVDGDILPNQTSNPTRTFPPLTPPSPTTASQNHFIIPPPLSESLLASSPHSQSHSNNRDSATSNSTPNPPQQPLLQPTVAFDGRTADNEDDSNNSFNIPPPLFHLGPQIVVLRPLLLLSLHNH